MLEKVRGTYQYVQHVRIPGMLHGRVVWPQGQVAGGVTPPKVISIDESSIKNIPGIVIVRRQNFVAVAAEREWDAVRAARQLKVTWEPFPAVFPGHDRIHDTFRAATTNDDVVVNTGDADAALRQQGLRVASASYRGPYESHGTMAPNCAVADVKADSALVMCSAQGIYQTRASVAGVTGLPADNVRVQYYSGSNTYGSSCYTDAAEAAAIMSQELGKPVRLQLSRQDEFGWDNYGPAHLAEMRGAVDAAGKIVAFEYQAWGHDGTGLAPPRDSWRWVRSRVAAEVLRRGPLSRAAAKVRCAAPGPEASGKAAGRAGPVPASTGACIRYVFRRTTCTTFPIVGWSSTASPGGGSSSSAPSALPSNPPYFFAQEGMIDELAYLAQLDPYEFRKRNISDPRWLGVLKAAADAAKWTPRVAASNVSAARVVTGRGIGLGTHHLRPNQGDRVTSAAAVVDIEVNRDNGIVRAKHVYGAMDCGLAINPGASRARLSACRFTGRAWP